MPSCPTPKLHVQCKDGTWLLDDGRYGQYRSPYFLNLVKQHLGDVQAVKTGCKSLGCYACKQNRSLGWTVKAICEAKLHEVNSFATLTYAPEHLPPGGDLDYHDVTMFFWRLRAHLRRKHGPTGGFRYLYCGEYGEQFGRPHYHVIFFGYEPDDLEPFGKSKSGDIRYTSKFLTDLWGFGHVDIGRATPASMAYVANYTLGASKDIEVFLESTPIVAGAQDLNPMLVFDMLDQHDQIEERKLNDMTVDLQTGELTSRIVPALRYSTKPSIGRHWYDKWAGDCLKGYIAIDGRKIPIPPNFAKVVKDIFKGDPERRERIRGPLTRLDDIVMPDLREQHRLLEYTQAIQLSKRRDKRASSL